MQVTLVNPPYPIGSHSHPPFIPLGLGYLAAVLEKKGYDVNVIDCQALNLSFDEVEGELHKRKPSQHLRYLRKPGCQQYRHR